jgi:hypothetical protein
MGSLVLFRIPSHFVNPGHVPLHNCVGLCEFGNAYLKKWIVSVNFGVQIGSRSQLSNPLQS